MKIVALKLIKPNAKRVVNDKRYQSVVKGLLSTNEKEKVFWFYNNYKFRDGWFQMTTKTHFSDNFNDPFDECSQNLKINICAIVGKNGSGKSSITELIIRLINNLACSILGDEKNVDTTKRLHFIPDIFADLYFEVDGTKYKLVQRGCEVALYSNLEGAEPFYENKYDIETFDWTDIHQRQMLKYSPLKNFFYSIVVNYSHYSYNIYDLKEEWDEEITKRKLNEQDIWEDVDKCWLTGIFHKNDEYQTPIVLNPFRTGGHYINVKREAELEKDRFLTIILALNNQENVFKRVIDNKEVHSLLIKKKDYNKLDQYRKQSEELELDFAKNVYIPIVRYWRERYPIQETNEVSLSHNLALDYLVYKTLRIGFQYKALSWDYLKSVQDDYSLLYNTITRFIRDNSHITLKLKQTLSFLMHNHIEESENMSISVLSEKVTVQVKEINLLLEEHGRNIKKNYPHGYTKPGYVFNEIDCLPPPIFDTELFLKTENSNENPYPFNTLSSGEKQMIYTVSSILYHVNNINSVHQKGQFDESAQYKHINIILEEVELYYHPEMQRKLIKYLIDQIKFLKADYIKSLQIMLVTHSPFVLSDIPINNVLFLENGSPSHRMREKHNTFSANIYDLFHESFFLDAPMGEFAASIIKRLFEDLKDKENEVIRENMLTYEAIINQIGDEFLRFELKRQLYDKTLNTTEAKIKLLEEQIKVLKKGGENA